MHAATVTALRSCKPPYLEEFATTYDDISTYQPRVGIILLPLCRMPGHNVCGCEKLIDCSFTTSSCPFPTACDSGVRLDRSLDSKFAPFKISSLRFYITCAIIMSTWFTVIGRIAQIEGMSNTSYKNALVEFEEGDSDYSTCRCFYVAFWGDILQSGRNYVIFGTGRLTGNEDCSQPKFTVTHAIPFVSDILPIHYMHILVAVDVKATPKLEADGKSYAFEGSVTGYYNDPMPASLRNDPAQKSQSTHTSTQYFYATISPRLERVLGSLHASTKIFVDGDYTV